MPQSMARCIVRTDTNEVLGVHGSKYKAIKHDDVINSVFEAVNKSGISKDYEKLKCLITVQNYAERLTSLI